MRTHNTEVVSSIPLCVTFEAPLVRKATGNRLMNFTFVENLRALSLVSVTLEIESAMHCNSNNIELIIMMINTNEP